MLLGTIVQLGMSLIPLRWIDFRFKLAFNWRDPRVKQVFLLMLPVTIGLGVINFDLVINSTLGTLVSDAAPRAIDAAFRIYMLPQGMFSVALATVLFPTLSRYAARHDWDGLRTLDGHGRALDLPAADPGGRLHGRARDADRAADLPARRVRPRLDRGRVHGAVLVLVQPAVRRREPAADAHVLQPAAAVDPDRPGDRATSSSTR